MLQFFRNIFKSKFGALITLGFLAIIAFAFASSDVANTGMFGGVTGGDRVAAVGDRRISTSDYSNTISNEVERARAQQPTLSMESFIAGGGAVQVLEQMISRWAIADFAEVIGLRAGDRLVDSEIVQMPAFRGVSGNFDAEVFRQALAQQGLNESAVRNDLAMGLTARQLMVPVMLGARLPVSFSQRYAQLLAETRIGRIAALPAGAYAPTGAPTAAQLQTYYTANRDDFIRPERRVLRYASFGEAALATVPAPTAAQIAARYQRDIANYRAKEMRSFTQLVLPTQAAAQAVVNEVRAGTTLEASARAKGLATVSVPAADRAAFTSQTSAAVAAAGFAAAQGALAAPAQGGLGWYVLRVNGITRTPGRSLEQARGEISAALAVELRREALIEATARIEEEFSEGRSLAEVAAELGLTVATTRPITANGLIYGTSDNAPSELAPVLALAFEMEESEPQLAETVPGQSFMVFDVSDVTASAAAPLAEIREDVTLAWRRDRGMAAAGEAAARVLQRVRSGQALTAALAEEEKNLPAPQPVSMNRNQLAQQGQQVPPPLMLLFSMAEGTAKTIEQEQGLAWFLVQLDDIATTDLPANSPAVTAAAQQLASSAGDEYAEQLIRAVEEALEVETNQAAVDAVIAQLTGRAQ